MYSKEKDIMEIKIENYLSEEDIREIAIDELRNQIRSYFGKEENANRLISNISYQLVFDEVDKIVPNSRDVIVDNVVKLVNKESSYSYYVFREKSGYTPASKGMEIMEQTVQENKQLIKDKVVEAIQNRNYSEEALLKLESLGDEFIGNIYNFVEMMRTK